MQDRPEQRPASETTNTVEGGVETATQLGSNYGDIGVFRGNNSMVNLGLRWAVVIVVVITGIRVEVLERKAPLTGTVLSGQCGEPVNAHHVEVDHDREQPVSFLDDLAPDTAAQLAAEGLRVDPIRFPHSVSSTQPERCAGGPRQRESVPHDQRRKRGLLLHGRAVLLHLIAGTN